MTYTEQQQTADKAAALPVIPCPTCGKRTNAGIVKQVGSCLPCRVSRG